MADPFEDFDFRVRWDGRYIAGISKVSALVRSTATVVHRDGGSTVSVKSPGQTSYEPITLERGRTSDTAFEDWANTVPGVPFDGAVLGAVFRKDILIELYNGAGQLVMLYKVFHCWPSRYQTLSVMDANNSEDLIEQLTLEHDGWERDTSVVAPVTAT
jgi:phage tail-like protein